MTNVGMGRTPTEEELAIAKIQERFTPEKQVEFLQATASRVLTQTALIGTVLAAGGLVALTTIVTNPVSFAWMIAAIGGAFLAIILALATQITVRRTMRIGDLEVIKEWIQRYQGWRGVFVSTATVIIFLSVICAAAAVAAAMVGRSVHPTFDLTATITPAAEPEPGQEQASNTFTVKAVFTTPPTGVDDVLTLSIDSGGETKASNQKRTTGEAAISVTLEASALPTEKKVTITGESSSWSCTATISGDATIADEQCQAKP